MDLIQQQIAHEEALVGAAQNDARIALEKAIAQGSIDRIPRARIMLMRMLPIVTEAIFAHQEAKAAGPAAKLRHLLRIIDAQDLAVMALRAGLSMLINYPTITATKYYTHMGKMLCREIEVRLAFKVNQPYYDRTLDYLKTSRTRSVRHIQKTMDALLDAVLPEEARIDLPDGDYLRLGKFIGDPLIQCGLFEPNRFTGRGGTSVHLEPSPEAKEFLQDPSAAMTWGGPGRSVMLAPPRPWNDWCDGGYYSAKAQKHHVLVRRTKHQTKRARQMQLRHLGRDKMPKVYAAVNALQSVAYEINHDVCEIIERVFTSGGGVLGIPQRTYPDKPEFPLGDEWAKENASEQELEAFNRWKRSVHRWYTGEREHTAKLREFAALYRVVREHHGKAVYFPMHVDSRGRMYYWGTPNPQGSDIAKACLQFHEKRALGKRGLYWLKVHVANSLGCDKVYFDDRAAWVDERWDDFQRALDEGPENYPNLFPEDESPLCAIAGLLELRAAYASGQPENYRSGFIVHMDATCSGLQHYSAILRDEIGGAYVNLLPPGLAKADIYSRVLGLVAESLARDIESAEGEARGYAVLWDKAGLARSLTKKPCMTLVYGTTFKGVVDHCLDYLDESGLEIPEGIPSYRLGSYMATLILDAIRETVPSAVFAMEWLQRLAKALPDASKDLHWTTPLGMQVFQSYPKTEEVRVRLRAEAVEYVTLYEAKDELDPVRNANGIAPNFVHGLDSSHLGLTALACAAEGIPIQAIHDSMGTYAADVDRMHVHIREQFIAMYSGPCVLVELAKQLGIEATPPRRGSLNLEAVRDSWAFFC
ncbi:RNA polymerase [Pseudomonas phage vB_PaeP_130_113]|uniref:DNA-directed RNA polymerase n=1 Tax=Pseudomonas phage vB_PaeP_130_113 TaxID=2161784 RepID=A0A2R4P998_9CAUD|nr:RNA polymerase [Pseudomonas phage vB_PaeP_130_113]AVX47639.1 RNA polymerase [Pseudomonas phage vB_PaeP_130_113]